LFFDLTATTLSFMTPCFTFLNYEIVINNIINFEK